MTERTDLELIDHHLGRGDEEKRRTLSEQLATTPELTERYDDLCGVWSLLDRAGERLVDRDLWPGIANRLADVPHHRVIRLPWWARAAAIVVAAAIGYGTALLRLGPTSATVATAPISEAELTEQLSLSAFAPSAMYEFGTNLLGTDSTGSN